MLQSTVRSSWLMSTAPAGSEQRLPRASVAGRGGGAVDCGDCLSERAHGHSSAASALWSRAVLFLCGHCFFQIPFISLPPPALLLFCRFTGCSRYFRFGVLVRRWWCCVSSVSLVGPWEALTSWRTGPLSVVWFLPQGSENCS